MNAEAAKARESVSLSQIVGEGWGEGAVMASLPVYPLIALGAAACVLIAFAVWAIRRWRLKYTLRTLVFFMLLATSAQALWWHWKPWYRLSTIEWNQGTVSQSSTAEDAAQAPQGGSDQSVGASSAAQAGPPVVHLRSGGWTNRHLCADGRRFITSDSNATKVWDTYTGRCLAEMKDEWLFEVSGDGGVILTGLGNPPRAPHLWSSETGRLLFTLDGTMPRWPPDAVSSPDGRYAAYPGVDAPPRVWNVRNGRTVCDLIGHEGEVNDLSFSCDGTKVVTAGDDKTARIWELPSGRCIRTFAGHEGRVSKVLLSPDGRHLATDDSKDNIYLWDTGTGALVAKIAQVPFLDGFSPSGDRFGAYGQGGAIVSIWCTLTGRQLQCFYGQHIYGAMFSSDGAFSMTTGERSVQLWDSRTGKLVRNLTFESLCPSAKFSPDGRRAFFSLDTVTAVWDLKTLRQVFSCPGSLHRLLRQRNGPCDGTG